MDREKDSLLTKEAAIVVGVDGFCSVEEIQEGPTLFIQAILILSAIRFVVIVFHLHVIYQRDWTAEESSMEWAVNE